MLEDDSAPPQDCPLERRPGTSAGRTEGHQMTKWTQTAARKFVGLVFGATLLAPIADASAGSAFAGLAGAWSGSGTISLADGSKERLRCKGRYALVGGRSELAIDLRCASDSYRVDLSSNLTSRNGVISGTWSEASRGISGNVSGKESGGTISALVEAPAFAATLAVSTRGNHQFFSIRSEGDIRNVSLNLTR